MKTKRQMEDLDSSMNYEQNEIDDRNFIDMVTSILFINHLDPYYNSKEYYQKFSEVETPKMPNDQLMFSYPYPYFDVNQKENKKSSKRK